MTVLEFPRALLKQRLETLRKTPIRHKTLRRLAVFIAMMEGDWLTMADIARAANVNKRLLKETLEAFTTPDYGSHTVLGMIGEDYVPRYKLVINQAEVGED